MQLIVGLHSGIVAVCARERRLRSQFKLPLTAAHICEPSQRSQSGGIKPTKIARKIENGHPPVGGLPAKIWCRKSKWSPPSRVLAEIR